MYLCTLFTYTEHAMNNPRRYTITSALPYANGPIHVGHLTGSLLPADIFSRFLRLMDKDVIYICGSDEHGAAITMKASKEGTTPKEIVDKYNALFKESLGKIGMSFDMFHRTSDPLHHETSKDFFRHLYEKGEFLEQESDQYYDKEAQQFLADRYISGTCPNCSFDNAFGDQCEKCGSTLSPTDLINPKSKLSGSAPILKKTKHWYLQLDKHQEWLREWIEKGTLDGNEHHYPEDWKKHVIGQCVSWLDHGLEPRSMTRDLDWGVSMPEEIEGSDGKKLYVWLDAPIGYISSTRQWAKDNNQDWELWWKDKETSLIHFLGKDNIVFHCLIFPSILRAHGEYILPTNVPANQFMNLENDKISTSRNWAVWLHEYLDDFPGQEDVLRYYLTKYMPEQKDSEFTWKSFQDANNNELVNNLGNFVNRVVVLTQKYYEGVVPDFDPDQDFDSTDADLPAYHDSELLSLFDRLDSICNQIRKFQFRAALNEIMELSSWGNQLIQMNEPWKTIKEEPEKVKVLMNLNLQIVYALALILRPILPFTSDNLMELLGLDAVKEKGELLEFLNTLAEGETPLTAGHVISKPAHLFARIDDDVIQKQIDKLNATKEEEEKQDKVIADVPLKPTINYDDFSKLDIRTARVLSAEPIPKADKLLKLTIKVGSEERTLVAGIAMQYKPEEVVGKLVTIIANLAPRKLRGIESNGMVLMAEDGDGKLHFVSASEDATDGLTIS